MKYDVLIVSSNLQVFHLEVDLNEVQSWDPVGQKGVLSDGKSFKLAIINGPFWQEKLVGIRFKEYRLLGSLALTIKQEDLRFLQARMQLG